MRFLYRTADAKDSPQSIARIDRTDRKGVFCRSFSWAVLLLVIDRQWIITDRSRKYRPPGNESFCGAFSSPLVIAVGAVDIVVSFTDGL